MLPDERIENEQATSASQWKRPAVELVHLPSGNVAKLRRPQIIPMLQRGEIPNPLVRAAVATSGETGVGEIDPADSIKFMCWVVTQAFVEPVVVMVGDDPDAGETPADHVPEGALVIGEDLADEDIEFVVTWWESGASAFDTFREERTGAADGGDGSPVLDETVEPART